jgi:predicted phage tail component-like protein
MDFTFRGQTASSLGLRVKSKNRPILPDIRTKYVEVAGRDGVYDFSRNELQDRMIEIECAWIEPNVGDLRYRARRIAQWLFGTDNSRDRLIFTDEPDLYYSAKINNKIDLEQTVTMGEFTLMFRCDPVAYSVELAKDAYDLDSPTILYRDLTANDVFTFNNVANGSNIFVNNWGTYEVAPTLIISNPSLNDLEISLYDEAGVTKISQFFIKNIPVGNTLFTVEMENYMCYRTNTGDNRLNLTFGDWWKLRVGQNKIYVNGFGSAGSLEFRFNAKFL